MTIYRIQVCSCARGSFDQLTDRACMHTYCNVAGINHEFRVNGEGDVKLPQWLVYVS